MPACSEAKSVPVRPKPVATSSQIRRTSWCRHASATWRRSEAVDTNMPDAPCTSGSSTTAASSVAFASMAAQALAAQAGSA